MLDSITNILAISSVISGTIFIALIQFKVIKIKHNKNNQDNSGKAKLLGLIIIILGLTNFFWTKSYNNRKLADTSRGEWTIELKEEMTNRIANSASFSKSMSDDSARIVAGCYVEKYTTQYSLDEMWEQENLTLEEKVKFFQPLMNKCLEELGIKTSN